MTIYWAVDGAYNLDFLPEGGQGDLADWSESVVAYSDVLTNWVPMQLGLFTYKGKVFKILGHLYVKAIPLGILLQHKNSYLFADPNTEEYIPISKQQAIRIGKCSDDPKAEVQTRDVLHELGIDLSDFL